MTKEEVLDEVRRWIKRAEADLRVARKLLEIGEEPWIITFHAQQAVEKYLKAYLIYRQVRFRKTHDILELLDLCVKQDADFENLKALGLERFKEYATEFKYPSYYEPDKGEAIEAIEAASKVREFILKKLEEKE